MQIEVININNNPSQWALVVQFFELRKIVLVDQMGWELDIFGDYECDPYDGFHATYVVAHVDGEVIGGGRLHRTTALGQNNIYSYMIRDAYKGLLDSLPSTLADNEPPLDDTYWEFTRFISTNSESTDQIINAAFDYMKLEGATKCFHLGPPASKQISEKLGYNTLAIGPVCRNESGQMQAFCCEVQ